MGDKRPSIRTLPSGEKVTHYPDGEQVLIHEGSSLKDKLSARVEENHERYAEIKQAHQDAISAKKMEQSDKGLPPEKSAI